MPDAAPAPRWRTLLAPRWLAWHLFAVAAVAGMAWLGDWQLRRALAGNELSWAYTFEWPIFAVFGVVFWIKTIRDELHPPAGPAAAAPEVALPAGATGQPAAEAAQGAASQAAEAEPAPQDTELAEYNAYLARLSSQVKGHGRWHGLR